MREAGVFPLGEDALRLGEFATVRPRWRVCDLGTGSGILLVRLAQRESTLALTGVEIDPLSARTARENHITRTALITVGDFLGKSYDRSRLYDPGFTHGYREGKTP